VRKKIVQYGAGNIGRSLVGQLFSKAGWEVVFVDVVPRVIEALNTRGAYRVVVKEEHPEEILVEGVRGVDGRDAEAVGQEIATCHLMATAVGAGVLPRIAPTVARGLALREDPLNIILCENLRGAPELFGAALLEHLPQGFPLEERVGLIATSIGKMVPIMPEEVGQQDPLEVWAEAYNRIVADKEGFIGDIPQVAGLVVRECFEAYVDQKLFVHNLGHAVAAYLGDLRGAVTIAEAMDLPEVAAKVEAAMEESGRSLLALYPNAFTASEMREHIEDLCRRFHNHALGDTVFRVGRDRPRKYAPNDRLMGAVRADLRAGVEPSATLEGIAAGFFFSATDENGNPNPSDEEFDRKVAERGIRGVLHDLCELDPTDRGEALIADRIVELAEGIRQNPAS
jgi:mannitol-1-phosphate 5-dehydrogenase